MILRSIFTLLALIPLGLSGGDWDKVTGDCGHLFGEEHFRPYASLLYWKPYGDELDYLVQRSEYDSNTGTSFEDHIDDLKASFDYGFRVGFEMDLLCSGWAFRPEWTHYNNKSSRGVTLGQDVNAIESLIAIPFLGNSESIFESSSEKAYFRSKMRFHFDVIDLEMMRWFSCGKGLRLAPHIGIRTLRTLDRFSSEYLMSESGDGAYAQVKNFYQGYGIKAGLDVELPLPWNLKLFGRSSGSVTWGRAKLKHDGAVYNSDTGEYSTTELKETTREGRYIAELHAGIAWTGQICEFYPLYFELAFDQTYLFNQHRFYKQIVGDTFGFAYPSYQVKRDGDILLQGGSFTIGIDF